MILVLLLCVSVLALGVTAQSRIRIKHALSCKEVENAGLIAEAQYYRAQIERVAKPVDGPFRGFVLLPPASADLPIEIEEASPEAKDPPTSALLSEHAAQVEEWAAMYKDYEKVSDRYIRHIFEYPRNRPLQEEILADMDAASERLSDMNGQLEALGITLDDLLLALPRPVD